jgi:hypothetical protein
MCALGVLTASLGAISGRRLPIHVSIDRADLLPRPILAGAIAETAALWAVYGVDVDWPSFDPMLDCDRLHKTIKVAVDMEEHARERDHVLGETLFNGISTDSTIVLHYRSVVRIAADAKAFGEHAPFWSASVRDQIIARALGRVLAHELGHVLLHQRHSASGLMRADQDASRLAAPAQDALGLTHDERDRLSSAIDELGKQTERVNRCDPSSTPPTSE